MKSRKKQYTFMDGHWYPDSTESAHSLIWRDVPQLKHVKKLACQCDGSPECQYTPTSGSPILPHVSLDCYQSVGRTSGVPCPSYTPRPLLLQHNYRYGNFDGTAQWHPVPASHLAITRQRHNYYRAPLSPSGSNLRNRQIARQRAGLSEREGRYTLPPSGGRNNPLVEYHRVLAVHEDDGDVGPVIVRSHEVCRSCFVDKQSSVETPQRSKSADDLVSSSVTETQDSNDNSKGVSAEDTTNRDTPGDQTEASPANGEMKVGSGLLDGSATVKTPPTERKSSKMAAFSRFFKPWKWRRRKKPSEKIEKTAVDLERQISVRTSREDLIKRGVLKEVDETGQPVVAKEETISEDDEDNYSGHDQESVKECKAENEHKQANGSAATTPKLAPHSIDGDVANSISSLSDGDVVIQAAPPVDSSVTLSQDYNARLPPVPVTHHSDDHPSCANEELQRPESSVVEAKQLRIILPITDKERQVPVLQKISVIHDPPDYSPLPPQSAEQHSPAINTSVPYSHSASPALNNNIYSPTGLTYPVLASKTHLLQGGTGTYSPSTPPVVPGYAEVPIREPDLTKKPLRSALKGAKTKQLLQQQLQQKLQEKQKQLQYAESVTTSFGTGGYGNDGSLPRAPPKVAPKPKVSLVNAVRMIDPNNKENVEMYDNIPDYDNLHSDSDEDVQYDDRDRESILAAKVQRQDSLARFLSQRPERRVLIERNILPCKSDFERRQERELIGNRLTRRLSLRPTAEELEYRNILHSRSHDEYMREKEEKKRTLIRKLSFRPTVEELRDRKIIMFSDYVEVTEANDYDRRADKPWTRLTPKDKAAIRKELNEFKSTEMDVHTESRHLTRFHRP